jgi:Tfp pilus assembly protein PilO
MANDRGTILTALTVAGGCATAFFGFAWPNYRAAGSISREIAHLEQRIATSEEQHVSLDALATRLAEATATYETTLREIPAVADMAGLMRSLTREADKDAGPVYEQTLTFGRPAADPLVDGGSISILPLTVDMRSQFGPVFELLATAENMSRLVRAASLVIERSKESEDHLVATVRLEAVYETGDTQETK